MKVFGKGEHKFPKIEERFWDRFIEVSSYNKEKLESILNGKIIETPGHTSDSLSLLLDNGVLFCGDATMNGFPSIHNITIWIENLDEFSNSWRIICKTDAKKIYPSQGKPFDVTKLEENFKHLSNVKLFKL